MITQQKMLSLFYELLVREGQKFRKRSLVKAKKAEIGESVITKTSDGTEAKSTAEEGDWLVENQTSSEERYLVKSQIFDKKYELRHALGGGWGCFRPKGEILAKKMTLQDLAPFQSNGVIEFEAPRHNSVVVKPGDFLVIPTDRTEIYRITQKEFEQTYEAVRE